MQILVSVPRQRAGKIAQDHVTRRQVTMDEAAVVKPSHSSPNAPSNQYDRCMRHSVGSTMFTPGVQRCLPSVEGFVSKNALTVGPGTSSM